MNGCYRWSAKPLSGAERKSSLAFDSGDSRRYSGARNVSLTRKILLRKTLIMVFLITRRMLKAILKKYNTRIRLNTKTFP